VHPPYTCQRYRNLLMMVGCIHLAFAALNSHPAIAHSPGFRSLNANSTLGKSDYDLLSPLLWANRLTSTSLYKSRWNDSDITGTHSRALNRCCHEQSSINATFNQVCQLTTLNYTCRSPSVLQIIPPIPGEKLCTSATHVGNSNSIPSVIWVPMP
jgi:hypothetical protein